LLDGQLAVAQQDHREDAHEHHRQKQGYKHDEGEQDGERPALRALFF